MGVSLETFALEKPAKNRGRKTVKKRQIYLMDWFFLFLLKRSVPVFIMRSFLRYFQLAIKICRIFYAVGCAPINLRV
jgi:hypothetical protein